MQSVLDSLCRCFGTEHVVHDVSEVGCCSPTMRSAGSAPRRSPSEPQTPATPDMKRRTRSLALQDKQWDALFVNDELGNNNVRSTPKSRSRKESSMVQTVADPATDCVEQAQVIARAKLAASQCHQESLSSKKHRQKRGNDEVRTPSVTPGSTPTVSKSKLSLDVGKSRSHKRKRSSSSSRDDIFRNRRSQQSGSSANRSQKHENAFSRFLSNHPALASSLCFATPIKDSSEETEPATVPMGRMNSLVSDTNTVTSVNTAEDTITSTLYYETTKLAGMTQTSPPMPLYTNFAVEARDEISVIVATDSHSSARMREMLRRQNQHQQQHHVAQTRDQAPPKLNQPPRMMNGMAVFQFDYDSDENDDEDEEEEEEEDAPIVAQNDMAMVDVPDVTQVSSGSSDNNSRDSRHIEEAMAGHRDMAEV